MRYRWGEIKLPQGYKWKDAQTFTDREYYYPRIDILPIGQELVIRFKPSLRRLKTYYLTIKDYKELTALQVINDVCGYALGRHFEDGILTVWRNAGLRLGFNERRMKKCRY